MCLSRGKFLLTISIFVSALKMVTTAQWRPVLFKVAVIEWRSTDFCYESGSLIEDGRNLLGTISLFHNNIGIDGRSPFHSNGLTLIRSMNYTHSQLWCEITHLFLNFNNCTSEICEWTNYFIPHFVIDVITCPCWDWCSSLLVKRAPDG